MKARGPICGFIGVDRQSDRQRRPKEDGAILWVKTDGSLRLVMIDEQLLSIKYAKGEFACKFFIASSDIA